MKIIFKCMHGHEWVSTTKDKVLYCPKCGKGGIKYRIEEE